MDTLQKELKNKYKNRQPEPGVIQIKNLQNGKIYIRGHLNLHAALNRFPFELKMGIMRVPQLQADYNALGSENFSFDVLERLEPNDDPNYDYSDDLQTLVELWIEKLQPFGERGYNIQK